MRFERIRVGEVLALQRRAVLVQPDMEYEEIGIRSFGRGIFHKEPVSGASLGAKRVFRVEPGDLVISNVFAWEGAIAVASEAEAGRIGSHRFMTFVPKDERIDPSWAAWFLGSEPGLDLIGHASPGSAGRNRTLAIERFEALEIPLPPIDEQHRVARRVTSGVERVRTLLGVLTEAEDLRRSLMPSARRHVLENPAFPRRPLEEVARMEMGQSPPGGAYNELGEGMPLLNGPTEFGIEYPSPRQWTTTVTKVAEPGDLLICVRATIGRTNWADQRYCVGRGLAAIRPHPELLDGSFLRHALLHLAPVILSRTAGSTFANLSGKRLARLPIPVPELKVQRQVASNLSSAEKRSNRMSELSRHSKAIVGALQSSLLNEAFGGLS